MEEGGGGGGGWTCNLVLAGSRVHFLDVFVSQYEKEQVQI